MSLVSVVIPVYKSEMDNYELISFIQVCKVLKDYPITIICPNDLVLNEYYKIYLNLLIERFDSCYFNGLNGYNRLMLSFEFYKRFEKYNYILIYQLDALVFRDELKYWCNAGYDYIGAPWFEKYCDADENSQIIGVGNGGFSLRNIKYSLKILKQLKTIEILNQYSKFSIEETILKFIRIYYEWLTQKDQIAYCIKIFDQHEDLFWAIKIQEQLVNFKSNSNVLSKIYRRFWLHNFSIAPKDIAMKFSFENLPRKLYLLNNNELPFGCHAWFKYDYDFWKPFLTKSE